jgi:hypothetical protein
VSTGSHILYLVVSCSVVAALALLCSPAVRSIWCRYSVPLVHSIVNHCGSGTPVLSCGSLTLSVMVCGDSLLHSNQSGDIRLSYRSLCQPWHSCNLRIVWIRCQPAPLVSLLRTHRRSIFIRSSMLHPSAVVAGLFLPSSVGLFPKLLIIFCTGVYRSIKPISSICC